MARCPFATWRPLSENETQGRIDPTQFILHTAVDALPSNSSLWGYFERRDVTVESTFYVKLGGEIEQYLDTTVRADANYTANARAISVETEDDGTLQPWTPQQIDAIKRLGDWVMAVHPKVARRVCPAHDQPGWGYHSMWGAPSPWTPVAGKTCPGGPRIHQFETEIRPWLAITTSEDWFAMATREELEQIVIAKGPWLGVVDGDPSGAIFVFHAGQRAWVATTAGVTVQTSWFRNVYTQPDGRPWEPTLDEAQGFHLVNRDALEAHLGHPYEF